MLLPAPDEPTSAVDVLQHRYAGDVLEAHVLEHDVSGDVGHRGAGRVFLVLGAHLAQLADAVEPCERFHDLRADRGDVDDRCGHEPHEEDVHEEVTQGHGAGENRVPALEDHEDADRPDHDRGECADRRDTRHRGGHVAEQRMRAPRKY